MFSHLRNKFLCSLLKKVNEQTKTKTKLALFSMLSGTVLKCMNEVQYPTRTCLIDFKEIIMNEDNFKLNPTTKTNFDFSHLLFVSKN